MKKSGQLIIGLIVAVLAVYYTMRNVDRVVRDIRVENRLERGDPNGSFDPFVALGEDFDHCVGWNDGVQPRIETLDAAGGRKRV